ncbi:MAG: RNA polymerase sigma factor [Planctomycetota bacterium]|jgi:RNA polymerase sigma-70 factor (ECF subfamily)
MKFRDQTDMGGTRGAFLTTHWSLIEHLKDGSDTDGALIGLLLRTYWKPVYCYLRHKGYDNEQAKDLTQDFFHQVVLNRHLVGRADKDRGRFRSFLLYALNQYLINRDRDERAKKRIPRERLASLDVVELPDLPQSFSQATAEDSYHYAWLSTLLERATAEVRAACQKQGMETHWALFHERVLQPILGHGDPASLSQLCENHGIEDTKKASNMIVTVKRRFRSVLMELVRNTVVTDEQAHEEFQYLLKFLPENAQRPE